MDPLSQAVLGASLSQCFAKKEKFKVASIAGALGGLLPDIDVLIHYSSRPFAKPKEPFFANAPTEQMINSINL